VAMDFPGRLDGAKGIARQFSQSNNPATLRIKSIRLIAHGLKPFSAEYSI